MRKLQILLLINILAFTLCSNSFATDFGLFLDGASGSGEFEWNSAPNSVDMDSRSSSIGFILDTATTNERVFNYRMNLGLSSMVVEDDYGSEVDAGGIYIENIFGFGLVRRETFRWWLGPLVRIGYFAGDDDYGVDYTFFEFGLGVATGLNFKLNNVILAPSIGVRFNGYAGEGEFLGITEDFTANSTNGFVNFAILF